MSADARCALGIFVAVSMTYALTSPGRIDIIDGQYRFEVAHNLMRYGEPFLADPNLRGFAAREGREGIVYSVYGPGASYAALPLMVAMSWLTPSVESLRFAFSLTSCFLGAAAVCLYFLLLRRFDLGLRTSLFWTTVLAFGTLLWPVACSTFDQAQHAFWFLAGLALAREAALRGSTVLALASGLTAGITIDYQEALSIPAIGVAIALLPLSFAREGIRTHGRLLLGFVGGFAIPILLWWAWSEWRFGTAFIGGLGGPRPRWGNPIMGLADVLVSPGNGLLWYSPPVLFAIAGLRRFVSSTGRFGQAVCAVVVLHLALVASTIFHGGGWCWGPRLLVPILPALSLAAPFAAETFRRKAGMLVVTAGVLVQLLALSLEPQRFLFERGVPTYFYETDTAFYFRESALFARPGELWTTARDGMPAETQTFLPQPSEDWRSTTYTIFGYPYNDRDPRWVRGFSVFYLPRPWPLWGSALESGRFSVPVPVRLTVGVLGLFLALGAGMVASGVRKERRAARAP